MSTVRLGDPQPELLFLGEVVIQPMLTDAPVESKNMLKILYNDPLPSPIMLKKGDPVRNYCAEQTLAVFYGESDSLVCKSKYRLNCEISAIFQLNRKEVEFFQSQAINRIKITNLTTENFTEIAVSDRYYFKRTFFGR